MSFVVFFCCSYGRVYTADPYHAALAPAAAAAAYGVGAMVRPSRFYPVTVTHAGKQIPAKQYCNIYILY